MRLFSTFLAAIIIVLLAFPPLATAAIQVETYKVKTSGKYFVQLKPDVKIDKFLQREGIQGAIILDFIETFIVKLKPNQLSALSNNPYVVSIAEDPIAKASKTQKDAQWNLARLNSAERLVQQRDALFTYKHDENAGQGVDIYVLDTGVFTGHQDFGGRARWGATFAPLTTDQRRDKDGHGTHCAAIAAGTDHGVAKKANIIAVKVLDDSGARGLHYVRREQKKSKRPSIVSMSIDCEAHTKLDNAAKKLVAAGVHLVVSAGNDNGDYSNKKSPARLKEVITVGASNIKDQRAEFSNYGKDVDIFAPGDKILSAGIRSAVATKTLSGTSMAAPHVAGIIAALITREGNLSPALMAQKVKNTAVKGLDLTKTPGRTTTNKIAHIRDPHD